MGRRSGMLLSLLIIRCTLWYGKQVLDATQQQGTS
jgi:hypothetical protein